MSNGMETKDERPERNNTEATVVNDATGDVRDYVRSL